MKDLIDGCFKKELLVVGKSTKDTHMSSLSPELILVSANKNAHVLSVSPQETVAELNLKNREMSSSHVHKNVLLIGTYVDTLFVFALDDFSPLFNMRTHDSILSMAVLSSAHNFIALG
mmetsp:Transcript_45302/g.60148  ORF Transcript_45302/g.60148 Transcript_45302/m.60148 type:complete len:118 (-) Transcript_45302:837-1190(-)|eukprot:CAMPEP_0185589074 /NCGR_PEP_ID=MMETSP0434-20130131/55536_1 /TAXON_ID=626734 ORGANISM="Favella taraikaensis, Strain Fe Narragansett Bay" /NCGR_SAMPLE_ID=MMETSP0434 /ASSEMBLY_ACC=CAM_ASM_000379 /LENGTH=117 /DNA_ID=CAMNT_0028212179 /DNA_START=284 /DNA_END=637 /DNA_ORIENTATION=+